MNKFPNEFYLVIDEALRGVEVEGEDDSGPFEDDDLVVLVLARNVPRIGGQPTVLLFEAKQSVKKIMNVIVLSISVIVTVPIF